MADEEKREEVSKRERTSLERTAELTRRLVAVPKAEILARASTGRKPKRRERRR